MMPFKAYIYRSERRPWSPAQGCRTKLSFRRPTVGHHDHDGQDWFPWNGDDLPIAIAMVRHLCGGEPPEGECWEVSVEPFVSDRLMVKPRPMPRAEAAEVPRVRVRARDSLHRDEIAKVRRLLRRMS